MNCLTDDFPKKIISIDDNLYFDTDLLPDEDYFSDSKPIHYAIETSYRNVIEIMKMYQDNKLTDGEKVYLLTLMFYPEEIPNDRNKAVVKAIEFLNCGEQPKEAGRKQVQSVPQLWTWEQDGNFIYAAINYSHNDILKNEPDLHWWEFYSKFMQLKDDCRFLEIVNNRLAYKKGKMTAEQRTARRQYPDMYVLKSQNKVEDAELDAIKEMERKLNS